MKTTFIAITVIICHSIMGQTNEEKYEKDVQSIDAIVNAYYDVVSGASSEPWQFERDNYIHSKNAFITRLDENGNVETHRLEAEYIPVGLSPKEDFTKKN